MRVTEVQSVRGQHRVRPKFALLDRLLVVSTASEVKERGREDKGGIEDRGIKRPENLWS